MTSVGRWACSQNTSGVQKAVRDSEHPRSQITGRRSTHPRTPFLVCANFLFWCPSLALNLTSQVVKRGHTPSPLERRGLIPKVRRSTNASAFEKIAHHRAMATKEGSFGVALLPFLFWRELLHWCAGAACRGARTHSAAGPQQSQFLDQVQPLSRYDSSATQSRHATIWRSSSCRAGRRPSNLRGNCVLNQLLRCADPANRRDRPVR